MNLEEFIGQKWGPDAVQNIKRIRIGGDNNDKGFRYEALFASYLIARYKAIGEGHKVRISSQEKAWVDDLCVRIDSDEKINYQAKNSSGQAASWNSEMETRFQRQQDTDIEHHGVANAKQILLVSCQQRKDLNCEKIPASHSAYSFCEFFPYDDDPSLILLEYQPAKQALAGICATEDLSDMDVAYRQLRAQWLDVPPGSAILVDEIVEKAKAESKPNVFKELDGGEVPDWLNELLAPFPGTTVRVQSGSLIVNIKGTQLTLPGKLANFSKEEAIGEYSADSEKKLLLMLFQLSSKADF